MSEQRRSPSKDGSSEEDRIVAEAMKRFERASVYWSEIGHRALPTCVSRWAMPTISGSGRIGRRISARKTGRPVLTVNKLPQHLAQVTNEVRQNPPQSKVRPVDDRADRGSRDHDRPDSAYLEQRNAVFAITNAAEWQVAGASVIFVS